MENHNISSINTHRLLDCMELDANDHRDRLETMNESMNHIMVQRDLPYPQGCNYHEDLRWVMIN